MSRFRRVIHGVASGYVSLIAAAIYSLASIPLALHYLSKEQFGLWALMSSIGGYLSLIDLGMSGSVARLLIDHKDDRDAGVYGSVIKTGWLVLVAQGAIILLAGFLAAPLLSYLLAIRPELHEEFVALLRWQCLWLALTFVMRMFGQLLSAHQRMDIVNYSQTVLFALGFSLQWCFFHLGHGVFSLVWALIGSLFVSSTVLFLACRTLGFFPTQGAWGKASWKYFRELFGYGKDLFLVALGTQLISTSQTMIITRQLGLEAAGTWAVGTRAFNQVCQGIWRIIAVSMPAFSEMIVRGEQIKLRERFRDVTILSASIAGFCAITFACSNSTFAHVLSHGKVIWPAQNDFLLGLWMILLTVLGCHNNLVIAAKRIQFMRYIYFVEGAVFVSVAWAISKWEGITGIIICSIVCTVVFTFAYGIRRTSEYFQEPLSEIGVTWMIPAMRVIVFYGPVATAAWMLTRSLSDQWQLVVLWSTAVVIGLPILVFQGLPMSLRTELLARFSGVFRRRLNAAKNQ